jgi:valyl-tRNA synthetase
MILATTYATGQVPFKTVYLHGLVRTETGKKMSKSDPETIIDPLEIIPEYGADALRLALSSGETAGVDQKFGLSRIKDNRNFCNKLWNIARYIEGAAGDAEAKAEPKSLADHWILNKLSILTGGVDKDLDNFRFSEAYQKLYHFAWDDFADWYIEASKSELNPGLLRYVLESTLIVVHPFAPFITEAIWQNLELKKGHLLASQILPEIPKANAKSIKKFEDIKEVIVALRQWSKTLESNNFEFKPSDILEENSSLIERLSRAKTFSSQSGPAGLKIPSIKFDVYIDAAKEKGHKYLDEASKRKNGMEASINQLKSRLNPDYRKNAPAELVQETERQLEDKKEELKQTEAEVIIVSNWLNR